MLKPIIALALILAACNVDPDQDIKPRPIDPNPVTIDTGPARIVHTGKNLVIYPGLSVQESVYVAGTEASAWSLALKKAPAGVSFGNGRINYSIPEGLSGPQEVRMIATRPGAVAMESSWTVTAMPVGNRAPTLAPVEIPAWIVGGTKLRIVFHAQDPDGDSLTFSAQSLPMGAVLKDSILEWSPPAGKAVTGQFEIHVRDGHNGIDRKAFNVVSISFDPAPYVADPIPGRSWWMRGYTGKSNIDSKSLDTIRIRRRITVTERDAAAGTFTFRLVDTLGNTDSTTRDTLVQASSRPGFGFNSNSAGDGSMPFIWPTDATVLEDRTLTLQGKDYAAKWVFFINTCLNGGGTKFGCNGSESLFAKGLGLVVREYDWRSDFTGYRGRDSLAVWAVSGP